MWKLIPMESFGKRNRMYATHKSSQKSKKIVKNLVFAVKLLKKQCKFGIIGSTRMYYVLFFIRVRENMYGYQQKSSPRV